MARLGIATLAAMVLMLGIAASARAQGASAGGSALDLRALFNAVGRMYELDPDLLAAIAAAESNDRADAVSPKGAAGLMQLMPATARRLRVDNAFDPVQSALGAARLLVELRRDQSVAWAPNLPILIAAYNAGEGAVERYNGVPPYPETELYVRRVLHRYLLAAPTIAGAEAPAPAPAAVRKRARDRGRMHAPGRAGDGDGVLLEQLAELRRARLRAERGGSGG